MSAFGPGGSAFGPGGSAFGPGGVSTLGPGGVGCLLLVRGVSAFGSRGCVCLWSRGVSQRALGETPLGTESQTPVKT